MKKIIFLLFLGINFVFGQNSSEIILDGSKPILRATGFGSVPQISGFTSKTSTLGHTGSTSTTSNAIGVLGYSNNSSNINYGVYGFADGQVSTDNIGVLGYSNLYNSRGYGVKGQVLSTSLAADFLYGGHFQTISNAGVNGGAVAYGVFAHSTGLGGITTSYGIASFAVATASVLSQGIYAESATTAGTANEFGGTFVARGASTGAYKTGLQAKSSGATLTQFRYGVHSIVDGPSSGNSFGVYSDVTNTNNGVSYGGYFKVQGTGTGSKYGLYATASGNGTLYAANLDGKVGIGPIGGSYYMTLETNFIDAWNGGSGSVLQLNSANNSGISVGGNISINSLGSIFLDKSGSAGEVYRSNSGVGVDMLPIAYGNISATGVVQTAASTSNISVTKTATGTYQITVTGESFGSGLTAHTVIATIKDSFGFITPSGNGTNLIITTGNTSGTLTDKPFTFVIYK